MLFLIIPCQIFRKSFDDNWFSEGWPGLDPQVERRQPGGISTTLAIFGGGGEYSELLLSLNATNTIRLEAFKCPIIFLSMKCHWLQ